MRPQQQNRRMRGRGNNGGGGNNNNNNNNRRGPNPLTRSYESNGPDVKIRGSAQQIAEKYTTLARDAQSSGDRVMAENYLQHAEHYNRIIAAAQAQMAPQMRESRDDQDEDGDEERGGMDTVQSNEGPRHSHHSHSQQSNAGSGPQPVIEGVPAEVALEQGAINGVNGHAAQNDEQEQGRARDEQAARPEGEEGRARRPRRPRRSRTREGGETGDDEQVAAPVEPTGAGPALAEQPE